MDLTKDNFTSETSDGVVLVDFWAEWCGPCQAMMPVLEELEQWGMKVRKVNVDNEPELAGEFWVMSIPMLLVMKDGEVKEKFIGWQPIEKLKEAMEKHA